MIFITGGTGFLGSHLLYLLIKQGKKVIALKRKTSTFTKFNLIIKSYQEEPEIFHQSITWVNGDLLHLEDIFKEHPQITEIYHLGALVSFQQRDRKSLRQINVLGTRHIVDLSLSNNINKFCFVSSIAAIGRENDEKIISEKTEWIETPYNTNYGISKHNAELEIQRGIAEGLNACIVNPGIIMGPGEINSGSTKMIQTVIDGLKFYPPGSNGFIDVRDVATIMFTLMEQEICSERYILISENLSYKSLFDIIALATNKKSPYLKVNPLLAKIYCQYQRIKSTLSGKKPLVTKETMNTSMNHFIYSNQKIQKQLNYDFLPIKESIKDTLRLSFSKST